MRSMQEIINLFVDGKVATHDEAMRLLLAEIAPEAGDKIAAGAVLAAEIANTATRLLPPKRAEQIVELLKEKV